MDDWEGGERQDLRWRRPVAALLAAVVVGSLWFAVVRDEGLPVVTDGQPVSGVDPVDPDVVVTAPRSAGGRWVCSAAHPVRAFDSGVYFPPEHPASPPPDARPDGCYADRDRAESAGYRVAVTPAGVEHEGDLYLVPAVRPAAPVCQALADEVGFTVPCPGLLPHPGDGATCMESRCRFHAGVIIEQRGFPLPAGWCSGCTAHVVITAVRDRSPAELITCGPEEQALAEAGGSVTGFFDCGPGPPWQAGLGGFPHERHTLFVWARGDLTYAISIEGHGAQQRVALQAMVAALVETPP